MSERIFDNDWLWKWFEKLTGFCLDFDDAGRPFLRRVGVNRE